MFEKLSNIFKEKDEKKRIDNLIAFLIVLVITLIFVNKIWNSDSKEGSYQNQTNVELVDNVKDNSSMVENQKKDDLERKLENILSKISGVRKSRSINNL